MTDFTKDADAQKDRMIRSLIKQRDDLLEACKAVVKFNEEQNIKHDLNVDEEECPLCQLMRKLEQAIQKAEK